MTFGDVESEQYYGKLLQQSISMTVTSAALWTPMTAHGLVHGDHYYGQLMEKIYADNRAPHVMVTRKRKLKRAQHTTTIGLSCKATVVLEVSDPQTYVQWTFCCSFQGTPSG